MDLGCTIASSGSNKEQRAVSNPEQESVINQTPDKRLQELRAFALEYVKQIVVKAGELTQERKSNPKTAANSLASSQAAINQAALQINHQFRLHSQPAAPSTAHKPHLSSIQPQPNNNNKSKKHKPRLSSGTRRFNWGLIVSCFSTCLPSTFTDPAAAGSTHSASQGDTGPA